MGQSDIEGHFGLLGVLHEQVHVPGEVLSSRDAVVRLIEEKEGVFFLLDAPKITGSLQDVTEIRLITDRKRLAVHCAQLLSVGTLNGLQIRSKNLYKNGSRQYIFINRSFFPLLHLTMYPQLPLLLYTYPMNLRHKHDLFEPCFDFVFLTVDIDRGLIEIPAHMILSPLHQLGPIVPKRLIVEYLSLFSKTAIFRTIFQLFLIDNFR